MNRIYRLVWSAPRACWVVAGERSRSRSKSGRGLQRTTTSLIAGAIGALSIGYAGVLLAGPPAPTALPQGGVVVAGSATIAPPAGNQLTVNQSSSQAVINWNRFDIGAAATVNFVQPGPSSAVLNRVLSSDPTQIFGKLNANGQVFIVNPAGIVFGAGSRVDTGGLIASTLDISNDDFMAGRYRFDARHRALAASRTTAASTQHRVATSCCSVRA